MPNLYKYPHFVGKCNSRSGRLEKKWSLTIHLFEPQSSLHSKGMLSSHRFSFLNPIVNIIIYHIYVGSFIKITNILIAIAVHF